MAKTKSGTRLGPKLDFKLAGKPKKTRVPITKTGPVARKLGLKPGDVIELKPTSQAIVDRLFLKGKGEKTKVTGVQSTRNVDITVTRPVKNFSPQMKKDFGIKTRKNKFS